MKPQVAWHSDSVLPMVITRGVRTDHYEIGVAQLQTLMMQFQRGNVPDNHERIEHLCRDKAKKLNLKRPSETSPVDERRWFLVGLQGLRRSKKQAEAKKAGAAGTFAAAEAAQAATRAAPPLAVPSGATEPAQPPA